jgi:hypothetical protein
MVPFPGRVVTLSEAKKYHGYARECLKMAEEASRADVRERLVELSRVWMEAALREEQHYRDSAEAAKPALEPG